MIISNKHRFILLTPWKTAASTCHARLKAVNESPYSRFYYYNLLLRRVVHQHITYAEFQMLPESRVGYFTGSFVRDPYDRVYSGFLQLQKDIQEQPRVPFSRPWIKILVTQQLAENYAQIAAGGFDFDAWFALVEEHQIYEVGRNSSFPLHPAHYWTDSEPDGKVDFVGRVECFEHDFAVFCGKVGVEAPLGRVNENLSSVLPTLEAAEHPRYIARMSAASISKINSLFREDFDRFGYKVYH